MKFLIFLSNPRSSSNSPKSSAPGLQHNGVSSVQKVKEIDSFMIIREIEGVFIYTI